MATNCGFPNPVCDSYCPTQRGKRTTEYTFDLRRIYSWKTHTISNSQIHNGDTCQPWAGDPSSKYYSNSATILV